MCVRVCRGGFGLLSEMAAGRRVHPGRRTNLGGGGLAAGWLGPVGAGHLLSLLQVLLPALERCAHQPVLKPVCPVC